MAMRLMDDGLDELGLWALIIFVIAIAGLTLLLVTLFWF